MTDFDIGAASAASQRRLAPSGRSRLAGLVVFAAAALAVTSAALSAEPATERSACLGEIVCPVGDRGYHARLPDDWDGKSKLPVLLHFHGWKRQGTLIVKHRRIAGATARSGVLLLAPNGRNRTWDFWSADTPDVDFALAVLDDAARRWPIDETRIYVSGYSYGSAMAWRFACAHGNKVAALLAISGTLPDQSEDCPAGPVAVRHVHGLKDTVMDFPFGADGDPTYPVALWRRENGCRVEPTSVAGWRVTDKDAFTRYAWTDCRSGAPVTLDVHQRGHFIPVGRVQRQLDELL